MVGWLVDRQHILHRRDESGIPLGRNYPALFGMGLEETFFKTRPIVLSLARSTICSSTTFSSSNRKVQQANPRRGSEQAKPIRFSSLFSAPARQAILASVQQNAGGK